MIKKVSHEFHEFSIIINLFNVIKKKIFLQFVAKNFKYVYKAKKNINFVTLEFLIVKLQTKYNESGNKKSGTKSTVE